MSKSSRNKIYRTKLLTNQQGDVGFYYIDEEQPSLPPGLSEPYKFVVLDHLRKELDAKQQPTKQRQDLELMRLDAVTEARLVETFSERWRLLHKHYKTNATAAGWQKLAAALAQDYIPGLRIEFVHPTQRDLKKESRAVNITLGIAGELMRLKKSGSATKATELLAIKAFYRKWPERLGRKPKNIAALSTEYYMRSKPFFDRANLGYTLADLGLPTTKRRARKK